MYKAFDSFENDAKARAGGVQKLGIVLNGQLLERWLVKVAFGICKGGIATGRGTKINSLRNEADMLPVMFGRATMPLGWGLYMAMPGRPVGAPASFGVEPRTNPETGELMQLVVWLQAIEFWLCLGIPSPVQQEQYRPGGLRLLEAGTERQLELRLSWPPDGTSHAIFDVTRIGQMNGWDSREH